MADRLIARRSASLPKMAMAVMKAIRMVAIAKGIINPVLKRIRDPAGTLRSSQDLYRLDLLALLFASRQDGSKTANIKTWFVIKEHIDTKEASYQ